MAMTVFELVNRTRSYRRFDQSVDISTDMLRELVNLARLASSPRNAQPLKYLLINKPEDCEKVFPLLAWAGYLKDWAGPKEGERPTAYVVVLKDDKIGGNLHGGDGLAMQNLLLGATEKGLGGCIIGAFSRDKLRDIFTIDQDLDILHIIALGKPIETVQLEAMQNDDCKYWRDEQNIHHVPKRSLDEIIIKL